MADIPILGRDKFLDKDGTTTVWDAIMKLLNSKVDKTELDVIIAKLISELSSAAISITIVDTLPEIGEEKKIYFVPSPTSKDGNNIYDEYMWINNTYEYIGGTRIDFSDYWSKTQLRAITQEELAEILV